MTKAQSEARKRLKKLCPTMFESPKKKRERGEALVALLRSPLFTESTEQDRRVGAELQRALAEAHGYELETPGQRE